MSLLAVSRSFSPERTYDEELDFLSSIHASPPPFEFDFLLSPKDDMSHTGDQGSIKIEEIREREKEQEDSGDGDVSMTTDSNTFQHLHLNDPSTQTHNQTGQVDMFSQGMYTPYQMTGQYPTTQTSSTPIHQYHFHPYNSNPRDYSNAMRNRSPISPIRPMSPPLSTSPTSSLHHSPNLVSPLHLGNTPLESPANLGFHYQLPYAGTPLNLTSSLNVSPQGPGLGMVSGFPYPTPPVASRGKVGRPRSSRGPTARSKARQRDEDDDSDFDEGDDVEEGGSKAQGLGFSPTTQEGEDRVPISNKREDIRKARIESEQRRRDELREGFRRLKEVLPATTQRSSKSSLLDRSVAHIQSIEAANRYLLQQYETATKELEKLRQTNTELVHAVASNSRGSNSNSNSNSPRGNGNNNGNGSNHRQ